MRPLCPTSSHNLLQQLGAVRAAGRFTPATWRMRFPQRSHKSTHFIHPKILTEPSPYSHRPTTIDQNPSLQLFISKRVPLNFSPLSCTQSFHPEDRHVTAFVVRCATFVRCLSCSATRKPLSGKRQQGRVLPANATLSGSEEDLRR